MATKKIDRYPEETYIERALADGRARKCRVVMSAIAKPDYSLQARVEHIDLAHSSRLHAILSEMGPGGDLAPIVVFRLKDEGIMVVADGFHRAEVYRRMKRFDIPAYVIDGDRNDAIEYAVMCNRALSLARTKEDVKKAVEMIFSVDVWWRRSDNQIARHVGASQDAVSRYRREYCKANAISPPEFIETPKGVMAREGLGNQLAKPPKAVPVVDIKGDYFWKAKIDGVDVNLGSNRTTAAKNLREIVVRSNPMTQPKKFTAWTDAKTHMIERGIDVKDFQDGRETRYGLNVKVASGCLLALCKFDETDSVLVAIGRLVLAQKVSNHKGRMVIIVDRHNFPKWDQARTAVAVSMGIEFLTIHGFIESVKSNAKRQPARSVAAMAKSAH
jgi:hypothetical protein